jgi:hypothetical protein
LKNNYGRSRIIFVPVTGVPASLPKVIDFGDLSLRKSFTKTTTPVAKPTAICERSSDAARAVT